MPYCLASTTIERPSGVSSASEDICAASARSASGDARHRDELGGLAVAERDRAGLVEQQHVDVARRLDRAARQGEHVAAHQPVHAGDADGATAARRSSSGSATRAARSGWRPRRRCARTRRTAAASRRRPGRSSVSPASRMPSAISFGVLRRSAPSTRAIMRSRKHWPGSWVISTTIRSESTRVPPVTALRSPPASRMTGADSPVIADSSTEAMPSITVPSPGISSPASTTTTSPRAKLGGRASAAVAQPRDGLGAHGAQRVRLGLAAALGQRLGEVGEHDGQPQPERDREGEPRGLVAAAERRAAERPGSASQRGDRGADLDHEHDRVAELDARVELARATRAARRAACRASKSERSGRSVITAPPRRARG